MANRGDQGNGDIYSDDFQDSSLGSDFSSGTRSTWWTAIEPSTSTVTIVGQGTGDAVARFTVPDNIDYPWLDEGAIVCPTIYQSVTDGEDLDIRVLWKAATWPDPTQGDFTSFNLFLHQSDIESNPIWLNVYGNTSNWTIEMYAGGAYVTEVGTEVVSSLGLRIVFDHEGSGAGSDDVTFYYDDDSTGWTQIGSQQTGLTFVCDTVGFSCQRGNTDAAYTLDADWFWEHNTGEITDEDVEGGGPTRRVMVIS
jgi:hypothetical protein